jgi:hypothetical protein
MMYAKMLSTGSVLLWYRPSDKVRVIISKIGDPWYITLPATGIRRILLDG